MTLTLNCDQSFVTPPTGGGTYDKGTSVHIVAAESGVEGLPGNSGETYYFSRWSDGNDQRIRDIVLDSDLTLTAIYVTRGEY